MTALMKSREHDVSLVLTGAKVPEGFETAEVTFVSAEYPGQSVAYSPQGWSEMIVFQARPAVAMQKALGDRGLRPLPKMESLFDPVPDGGRRAERRSFFMWAKPVCRGTR